MLRTLLQPIRWLNRARRAVKYNHAKGYREAAYWEDRHRKYRGSFRAVASYEAEKDDRYPEQRRQLLELLHKHGVSFKGRCAVEFGCGNGFWGEVALEEGAEDYTGIDISPTAIDDCRSRIPTANFLTHHLGTDALAMDRTFDLVFSIDVTQHVVERDKLFRFLQDMERCAEPGSLIFCTSYLGEVDRQPGELTPGLAVNFVTVWSQATLEEGFAHSEFVDVHRFWDKSMLVFRRLELAAE